MDDAEHGFWGRRVGDAQPRAIETDARMMLRWLRRRKDARRLAQADGGGLIRDHGAEAYSEARWRESNVILRGGRRVPRIGGASRSETGICNRSLNTKNSV